MTDMHDHVTDLAKTDLIDWLEVAQPSTEALEKIKKDIRSGNLNPDTYWDADKDCGCFKGMLFWRDKGETPFYATRQHLSGFSRVGLIDIGEGSIYANIGIQIERHFNGAIVNMQTRFERWLANTYNVYSDSDQEMLISWIEEYESNKQ